MRWLTWQIYRLLSPANAAADEAFFAEFMQSLDEEAPRRCPRCGQALLTK